MKSFIATLFFVFMLLQVRSQERSTDPGILLIQLAKSKADTNQIRILLNLAYCYVDRLRVTNRMDSMNFYLTKARELNKVFQIPAFQNRINLLFSVRQITLNFSQNPYPLFLPLIDSCKKTGDKQGEADAWFILGARIAIDSQSFALTCYENALTLNRQLHNSIAENEVLIYVASIHFQQQKLALAESELLAIIKEDNKAGPRNIMFSCGIISVVYLTKGDYEKSLQYELKAIKMMGVCGDSVLASSFYHQLTTLYTILKKPAESLEWAKKDLDYSIATKNLSGIYSDIDAIARLLIAQGRSREALAFLLEQTEKNKPTAIDDKRKIQHALADAYNDLKMYDMAEKSYQETVRLGSLQTHQFPADKGYDNINMGSFYFKRGNYKKALPFLETALTSYKAYGGPPYIKGAHNWLFKTDSALGNYVSAIHHLQESNRLGDSIFNIARSKQIEELQVAYKTEQKDKSIRLLAEKEKLDQAELKHTQSTRNWIIAAALMLLIIAGLLFVQVQARKKTNKVINDKNSQLQHLLTEKEWLVKEIHHRVKNNFQTIMGLLGTQAGYQQNDVAVNAIADSQRRIQTMSLIHQKLYQTDNLSAIGMPDYIHELVDSLAESFNTGNHVRFILDIKPIDLDLAHCIPLGLIMNEAITNSFKYAFPQQAEGIIAISLKQISGNRLLLTVSDDGIGLPTAFNLTKSSSMGINLMRGLSEEIGAAFSISAQNGTTIYVQFIYEPDTAPGIVSIKKEAVFIS